MGRQDAWAWLETKSRVPLAHLPTPLEPLDRLSEVLGGPRIWCKRDDCTGLGTGGNKTRKLEYLMAEARDQGSSDVVTFGAVQSNHVRQTAAACAKLGLHCHAILSRVVDRPHPLYETGGNVQLDRLFGASVALVDPSDVEARTAELLADLQAAGASSYVIPPGGSNAVGALGYARAALELAEQSEGLFEMTDVFLATASAGTQSGLLLGFCGADEAVRVRGIQVYDRDSAALARRVAGIVAKARDSAMPGRFVTERDVLVDNSYLGPGYGIPTPATLDAVQQVAQLEGLLLDPVYSGKAMSGLVDQIRMGALDDVADVIFLHTGGTASLPAYDDVLGNQAGG